MAKSKNVLSVSTFYITWNSLVIVDRVFSLEYMCKMFRIERYVLGKCQFA